MHGSDSQPPKLRPAVEDDAPESRLVPAPESRKDWRLEDDHTWFFPAESEPTDPEALSLDESGEAPRVERALSRPSGHGGRDQPPATPGALPPFSRLEMHPAGPRLIVEILGLSALLDIEQQVLGRGLLVPLDDDVAIGTDLDVCILFPNVGHELWFFGRVVYRSVTHAAIDFQPTVHDKAQWLEASTAFRSKTPFARQPGANPYTEPPRLRRHPRRKPVAPPALEMPPASESVRRRRKLEQGGLETRREVTEKAGFKRAPSRPVPKPASRNRPLTGTARVRPTANPGPPVHAGPAPGGAVAPAAWAQRRTSGAAIPAPRTGATADSGVPSRRAPTGSTLRRPTGAAPSGFYGGRFGQQLDMRENRMFAGNKFALFGLHWSAYRERIQTAYEKEKALFDPAIIPNELLLSHGNRIHKLLEAYDSAWETLQHRASRRAHRAAAVSDNALTNAIAHYLEQGRTAAERGDHKHAIDCLRRVVDMHPQDTEASAMLAGLGWKPEAAE